MFKSLQFNQVLPTTSQIEKILKNFVVKGGKEGLREAIDDELCVMIDLIHKLDKNGWYKFNIQIISFIYDCFHKRLNHPFLVQSRGHWIISIDKYKLR